MPSIYCCERSPLPLTSFGICMPPVSFAPAPPRLEMSANVASTGTDDDASWFCCCEPPPLWLTLRIAALKCWKSDGGRGPLPPPPPLGAWFSDSGASERARFERLACRCVWCCVNVVLGDYPDTGPLCLRSCSTWGASATCAMHGPLFRMHTHLPHALCREHMHIWGMRLFLCAS